MRHVRHTAVQVVAIQKTAAERLLDGLFFLTLIVISIPPLYLAKSALGIDLLPGHSPLHDLLYWIVR
jgi:hypothetical protein